MKKDRLILKYNNKIISKGDRDYTRTIENLSKLKNKDNDLVYPDEFRIEKLKNWQLVIQRGGEYIKLDNKSEIKKDDIICVNKKNKIIVYRGGTQLQIDSKKLNPKTDHIINSLSKKAMEEYLKKGGK